MSLAFAGMLAVGGAIIALPADSSPSSAGSQLVVSPSGDDSSCSRNGSACATFDRAYQLAAIGDTVEVQQGTYPGQTIQSRADLRDLPNPCTPAEQSSCITFVPSGKVTIDGKLEVRGSSVYVKGSRSTATPSADAAFSISAKGYVDIEANSLVDHPDHVILEGIDTLAIGAFGVDTAWFRNMDVGPQTVTSTGSSCYSVEGEGFESKIGYGGGVLYTPRNVTIESVRIHDQNGDKNRELGFGGSGCHFGGLFLVAVKGLTVQSSVFERNVVYHVIIQGNPATLTDIRFDSNSFGCPVDWKYRGDVCDGQRAIQFSGAYPGVTLVNNVSANGTFWPNESSGLYGCYDGNCGFFTNNSISGNTDLPRSVIAPALPGGSAPPAPAPPAPAPPAPSPPSTPAPPAAPACANGVDDDGDGKIDLADPGCTSHTDPDEADPAPPTPPAPTPPAPTPPAPTPPVVAACANGVDDDGDHKIDLADPGCASHADDDETDPGLAIAPSTASATADATSATGSQPSDVPQVSTLRRGDTGIEVWLLQRGLRRLGYSPGRPDGIFGKTTEEAVVAFQKAEGLVQDGVAGPKTRAALDAALARA